MRRGGFSLVEISIVLVVISVMISGVLPYITESQKTNAANDTAERLEAIELAMLTFRAANGFIPCPSNITAALNSGTFGTAVASGCATANFTDTNNSAGGVPTRDLGLSDEYAFDGWGRRMTYHVTRALTGAGYEAGTGAMTVNDATGAVRTTAAAYAVVSHGPNGHGAYTRAGTRFSFGTTNANEQENCECNATATATTYDSILVQSMAVPNSDPLAAFDDIVRYQLKPSLELLVGGGSSSSSCTGVAPSGWPDAIKCVNGTTTIPLIYNADTGGGTVIYRRDHPTTDIQLQFNQTTQAYQSNANLTGYDCISKSIPTLESEGKTFNFCGGSGGGGTCVFEGADNVHANWEGFPKAIQCGRSSNDGAGGSEDRFKIFVPIYTNDGGSSPIRYGAPADGSDNAARIHYNLDGSYAGFGGDNYTQGCQINIKTDTTPHIGFGCGGGGSGGGGGGGTGVGVFHANGGSTSASSASVITNLVQQYDPSNVWDEASAPDRFQPTVAGDYFFYASGKGNDCPANTGPAVYIYKNGVNIASLGSEGATPDPDVPVTVTVVTNMNGTTDYVDFRGNDGGCSAGVSTFHAGGFAIGGGGGGGGGSGDWGAYASRAFGTTYTAASAGMVVANGTDDTYCTITGFVNGSVVAQESLTVDAAGTSGSLSFPVPNGSTYRVVAPCGLSLFFVPLN